VSYDETYAVFHNSTPYPSRFEVSGWTDIVDVAVGTTFTLGLKSDGTAVLAGEREGSEAFFAEVESWSDIIAITATAAHAAGLKADGTVVLAGTAEGALNDASGWRLRAPFSVSFNGVNVDLALPTAERNGHTFYPLEGLLEALGLSVGWNAEAFTVYAENNGNTVEIPLRALGYWINGVKLDAPAELAPFVENGKTYVYLDYIIQGLEGK
jgi:hypothetical protein